MNCRELHWWVGGWCSLYQWKHVFWQQDDYGNAVVVQRKTLILFNNINVEIGSY